MDKIIINYADLFIIVISENLQNAITVKAHHFYKRDTYSLLFNDKKFKNAGYNVNVVRNKLTI